RIITRTRSHGKVGKGSQTPYQEAEGAQESHPGSAKRDSSCSSGGSAQQARDAGHTHQRRRCEQVKVYPHKSQSIWHGRSHQQGQKGRLSGSVRKEV
ncbi:hypothetical protein H4S01_004959, partial [Coemansia sp. RSA 2610]